MHSMLDQLPCGYLEFDDNGLIRQSNNRFCKIVGYSSKELIGNHIKTLLTPGATVFYQTHLFPMLKMEKQLNEIYLTFLSNNGEKIPVLLNAERSTEKEPAVNRCIVVRMQRRSEYEDRILFAKKQAEETTEDKKKLISMMSHELRTPLSVILGMVEMLSEELDSDANEDIIEYLKLIETSSNNLARLADDILNFAKLETGNFSINQEVLLLEEVLDRSFLIAKHEAKNKDIECTRGKKSELKVFADPDRLQQILMNLLTNAIKFTESGDTIELFTDHDEQFVRIHVKDSGVGIPIDKTELIFQPFKQLNGTNAGGVGLGLSISRKLSREMGGDLTVSSTPGEGTMFTLQLPVRDGKNAIY